jgi:hypothetical protein
MKKLILILILLAGGFGLWTLYNKENLTPAPVEPEPTIVQVPADIQAHIDSKSDLIRVELPEPMTVVTSPLTLKGEARGQWYFEGSFPITLTNWDGLIIAESYVTFVHDPEDPESTWMTTEFVPFEGALEFENPSFENVESDHFSKRGYLIFKKDNPSGLPEHDDALEIPVYFE